MRRRHAAAEHGVARHADFAEGFVEAFGEEDGERVAVDGEGVGDGRAALAPRPLHLPAEEGEARRDLGARLELRDQQVLHAGGQR